MLLRESSSFVKKLSSGLMKIMNFIWNGLFFMSRLIIKNKEIVFAILCLLMLIYIIIKLPFIILFALGLIIVCLIINIYKREKWGKEERERN